jgi:predicted RNase H-like nuclease
MGAMSYPEWRRALEEVVSAGLREHRAAQVAAALSAEAARVAKAPSGTPSAGPPAPATTDPLALVVTAPVMGVDACAAGWVGVVLRPDLPPAVLVSATTAGLLDLARETGPVSVMAVDIPIGLPDATARQADALARAALPGKGSSVFTTLTRAAYLAPTYEEARAANLAATGGERSASAQAHALRHKILEVDAWLRTEPAVEVIEVHPELSFARIAGAPLVTRKKDPAGAAARRAALASVGLVAPPFYRGAGFAEDDLLDACAAAWSAARYARGVAESLPPTPEVFSDGIPAAIRV